jgi:hypothetical protein
LEAAVASARHISTNYVTIWIDLPHAPAGWLC